MIRLVTNKREKKRVENMASNIWYDYPNPHHGKKFNVTKQLPRKLPREIREDKRFKDVSYYRDEWGETYTEPIVLNVLTFRGTLGTNIYYVIYGAKEVLVYKAGGTGFDPHSGMGYGDCDRCGKYRQLTPVGKKLLCIHCEAYYPDG